MYAARQAWIETSNGAHDVDAFELVGPILFEDRCILHRVFVRPRRSIDIPGICVPRSGRIRVVVGDLVIFDHHMVREHATDGFVKPASDSAFGNLKVCPSFRPAGMQFFQSLFHEIQSGSRRVGLEVSARAITLDCVTPLWNFPLEFDLRKGRSFWQIYFHAVAGGLNVTDVHDASERRSPESRDWSASGVQCQMVSRALVEPAR